MEENNNKETTLTLDSFTKKICQKYSLDENILIENLNKDKNNFWNTLIELIQKKEELENPSNPSDKENNGNNEITNQTFNKEEIIKEIDNYIKENPDEHNDIWNDYKNNNNKITSIKDNNTQIENNAPTSTSTDKKNDSCKPKNVPTEERKKSVSIKKGCQTYRFSIKPLKKRRHQSILMQLKAMKPSNSNNFIVNPIKRGSKLNMIRSKFCKVKKNKNRRSLVLKIDKNSNFEYNSKKLIMPTKNRKSVITQQNNLKFKFNFNNINDRKKTITEGNNIKSKFNEKNNQKILDKDKEEKDNNKLVIYSDDSESDSESKSSKSLKEKEKKEQINNDINNVNDKDNLNNINSDKSPENEINSDNPKTSEENKKIPIYKNKNTVFTIYKKEKQKPKPKSKVEPKKYLNNYICHQVSISLNINNKKDHNSSNIINNNNIYGYSKKFKQKYDKIVKISSKSLNKNSNNDKDVKDNINLKNNAKSTKKLEVKTPSIIDEESIFHNKKIYSSEMVGNKNIINTNNNDSLLVNRNNKSFYQINIEDGFDENICKSVKNFQKLKYAEKPITTANNSQKEIIPKKAEIKYYKMYKTNNKSKKLFKDNQIKKSNNILNKVKENKDKMQKYNNNYKSSRTNFPQKKNNYIQMYKDAIDKIMRHDESIFNDEGDIFYIKKNSKQFFKKESNTIIKKKPENKYDIKNYLSKKYIKKKNNLNNNIKKNCFGSSDNIHKTKCTQ